MKNLVVALLAAFTMSVSAPVLAQTVDCSAVDVSTMSVEQISKLKSVCAANTTTNTSVTPDTVRQWAGLGKEFSDAVIETSRGLGMAANDFLFTPVGMLIAFYFLWDMIGGIIVGSLLLILVWSLYFYVVSRFSRELVYEREYDYKPVLFGLFQRKVLIHEERQQGGYDQMGPGSLLAARILGLIPAFVLTGIITSTLIF